MIELDHRLRIGGLIMTNKFSTFNQNKDKKFEATEENVFAGVVGAFLFALVWIRFGIFLGG